MTTGTSSSQPFAVAVDGPSGSGKSTTARGVARELGWNYLDTGAMYRAITWWMLQHDIDPHDSAAVGRSAQDPELIVSTDPDGPGVLIDGHDVTEEIRDPRVTDSVSAVSAVPAVRERLVELQREAMAEGPVVIEGRDIGTVVVPDAPLKVFLVASSQARAERRTAELDGRFQSSLEDTLTSLNRRDLLDSQREVSPLARASDAIEIDSTNLTLEEVIQRVVALVRERFASVKPS
ncbi:MAG TPA: (d)CMP kinase [Actinomycetes bacterium]|nr:(d)CMP kinase [Actinomycetes bacterium]